MKQQGRAPGYMQAYRMKNLEKIRERVRDAMRRKREAIYAARPPKELVAKVPKGSERLARTKPKVEKVRMESSVVGEVVVTTLPPPHRLTMIAKICRRLMKDKNL